MSDISLYSDLIGQVSENWQFQAPKKNEKGIINIYIQDKRTGRNPVVQLCSSAEPPCSVPFGVSKYDKNAPGRYNMSIGMNSDALEKFVDEVDKFVIASGTANEKTWFPKSGLSKRIYHSLIKKNDGDSDKNYSPILHAKTSEEELSVYLLDAKNEPPTMQKGTWDSVLKRTSGIPIVRVVGVWAQPRMWGLTVVVTHFLMNKPPLLTESPFIWDSSSSKPVMAPELKSPGLSYEDNTQPTDAMNQSVIFGSAGGASAVPSFTVDSSGRARKKAKVSK